MKQKTKTGLTIFLIILIILVIVGGLYLVKPSIFKQSLYGGFTVLSISNVQVVDNGARILVTAIPRGAQAIEIDFTPSSLNSMLQAQGYKATTSSILQAQYVESTKKFYFTTSEDITTSVKYLRVTDMGNYYGTSLSSVGIMNYCRNHGHPDVLAYYWTDTGLLEISNVNCVDPVNNGYVNAFNSGLGTDGFKVIFDLDGEQKYITGDEQYITMANGKAEISWVGNLLGINNIGAPNYDVYHVSNSWYLIDKNAYSNVVSGVNGFQNCMQTDSLSNLVGSLNLAQYQRCQSTYYSNINSNIVSKNNKYISEVSNAEGISFSQGVMEVNLKQPTFTPVFTIELDATKVGLIKLSGVPSITSCIGNQVFDEAGTKSVSATIKNTGTQGGYFDFQITCNNQLMSGHADSLNFMAGESKTVNFQIYGGNSGTTNITSSCTLKVIDRTSQKSVTCGYNMQVNYKGGTSNCTGSETQCSGDYKSIYTCVSGNFVQSACEHGCEYYNNIARCKPQALNCSLDTDCPSGQKCINNQCTSIQPTCSDKFFGLVPGTSYTTNTKVCVSKILFICIKEAPSTTNGCEYDWTLVYVIVFAILAILITLIVVKSKSKKK